MTGNKEIREAVAGLSAGILWAQVSLENDKKITFTEYLKLIGLTGVFTLAIKGSGEIYKEFIDLDELEYAELRSDVSELLVKLGLSHRNADVSDRILKAAYDMVKAIIVTKSEINTLPPVALPVQ